MMFTCNMGDGMETIMLLRVDYDRKLMVHISASTEVHEKGRNVAKKGMTTNTSMIDASKFSENLVSMESARIKGCMKDNNIIKDLRGEIEITEPQKTTDFNVDIMAIYAINVTKSFEGEFPAAADKGKQVEATECNLISQSHSNIRTGFRLGHQGSEFWGNLGSTKGKRSGDVVIVREGSVKKKRKAIMEFEGSAIDVHRLEKEVSR
ncbi:hypothetical protein QYF36_011793 [Acer negundo]|nr:hypothetical protein QYF36_011793 [Acer negundo]